MNSAARDQIIAAKERLNQMAEEVREADQRKAAKAYWEKSQAEERAQEAASSIYHQKQAKHLAQKEKIRAEAKAREGEGYLRLHNKTVKQVLSQVAKAGQGKDAGDVEEEEESEERSSSNESISAQQQASQQNTNDLHNVENEPT